MTENEERFEELKDAVCRMVCIAEDAICREGFEELDNVGAEIIGCLEEIQQYRAIGTVEELKKSVKEEDVLKFYYIESEDKYVVGRRVDTKYYAEVGKTGLAFYMSRYLPWGEHVVDPESAWKEHTYPSEPKEIPFFEWLQGFIKKECGGTIEECRTAVERMKSLPEKQAHHPIDNVFERGAKTGWNACIDVICEKRTETHE